MNLEVVLLSAGSTDEPEHKAVLNEESQLVCTCGWRGDEQISELPAHDDDRAWMSVMASWVGHLPARELLGDNP